MLDKVQPLLLNDASGGKSWAEHDVQISQVLKRDERVHEGSEEIWAYAKSILEENVKKDGLEAIKDRVEVRTDMSYKEFYESANAVAEERFELVRERVAQIKEETGVRGAIRRLF